MKKLCSVLLPLVLVVACGGEGGGSNNLTGPSSTIPNVAGNYSGTTTITFPEVPRTISCPSSTSITQGQFGNINIAPIVITGACGNLSLPVGEATINSTGSLGNESGTFTDTCGVYNYTASGGFVGRELRMSGSTPLRGA